MIDFVALPPKVPSRCRCRGSPSPADPAYLISSLPTECQPARCCSRKSSPDNILLAGTSAWQRMCRARASQRHCLQLFCFQAKISLVYTGDDDVEGFLGMRKL